MGVEKETIIPPPLHVEVIGREKPAKLRSYKRMLRLKIKIT